MVMIKADVRETETHSRKYVSPVKKLDRIVTLTSEEVTWLFGIGQTTLNAWMRHGVITPCVSTPAGKEKFLRADVAELLAAFGA